MAEVSNKCVNIQGEKDEVFEWIEKVRAKKREFEKRRNKNLRVQAVLNSTLCKSVALLRARQQEQRLAQFKLLRERALRKRAEVLSARPELMKYYYPTKRMEIHVEK
jgi:hypothetical protein